MEVVTIGLVLVGLVLVFFGAALSVYATSLLGFLIGAGSGYVIAPYLLGAAGEQGLIALSVAVLGGGILGAALAYVALSFATAVPAFIVGAYLGLYVITPIFTDGGLIRYLVMLIAGIAGAAIGFTLTKFALMFITAFIGAALASGAVGLADLEAVRASVSPTPVLFDPLASTQVIGADIPLFGVLLLLGLLSQIGLFRLGWMTKLTSLLPGIGRIGRKEEA